jgi:hypothetical protein
MDSASNKHDPGSSLKLLGLAEVGPGEEVATMQWATEVLTADGTFKTVTLATSTGLLSSNLVVQAGSLEAGCTYRFKLEARVSGIASWGSDYKLITTNIPPSAGLLECSPATGTAVGTTFTLAATGWSDDDLPLKYRFSAVSVFTVQLSIFSADSTLSTVLSAGPAEGSFQVSVMVEVADSYGARRAKAETVRVEPFEPGEAGLIVAAEALVASTATEGPRSLMFYQVVAGLATELNTKILNRPQTGSGPNITLAEMTQTRDIMVTALVSGGSEDISAETVAQAAQVLQQITARPEQLSPESTDEALRFVASFETRLPKDTVLDDGAIESVANVMSDLLAAATSQFAVSNDAFETEHPADGPDEGGGSGRGQAHPSDGEPAEEVQRIKDSPGC